MKRTWIIGGCLCALGASALMSITTPESATASRVDSTDVDKQGGFSAHDSDVSALNIDVNGNVADGASIVAPIGLFACVAMKMWDNGFRTEPNQHSY